MSGPDLDEQRKLTWAKVHRELLYDAIPDSRFHYDFHAFAPNFRGSSLTTTLVTGLSCYQHAKTILITPDNSLEPLRLRVLQDGKTILIATHRLRRGFVLLNPASIAHDKYALAACLDGMEKPGVGRHVSLAQLQEERVVVNVCAVGGLVFNQQGVIVKPGPSLFELQWAMLCDVKCLDVNAPIVAVAHACQVVDETSLRMEVVTPQNRHQVQCDYVVTPARVFHNENIKRRAEKMNMASMAYEAVQNIPPLEELKGVRMMEKIMSNGGMSHGRKEAKQEQFAEDEQRGIEMATRLLKGYKP